MPQRRFFRVVGLGGIAGRRPDALIFLRDQFVDGEPFARDIAPELAANAFVHALGEGFGQPIAERLHHDAPIVVGLGDVALDRLFLADARRDGEAPDPVGHFRGLRRDEVGERSVGAVTALVAGDLLAQRVQSGDRRGARIVGIDFDVVADRIRRPEADDGVRANPALRHQSLEHGFGIGEEFARLHPHDVVVENARVAARQFPGLEERGPIDVAHEFGQIVIGKHPRSDERRLLRARLDPIELHAIVTRRSYRDAALGGLAAYVRIAHFDIFGLDVVDVTGALGFRQQVRHDADGAARIRDVNGLAAAIVRTDLDGGVHATCGGATDQQRDVEAFTLHLGGDETHLIQRGRDQAGQPDDVGLLATRSLQDFLRRHHDTEIDDLVIVALEHDADDVLADVVHIALHGRHHDLACGRLLIEAGQFLFGLEIGLQIGDGLLHHARRLDDLRQEHFARAEEIADDVHAGHQRAFDDVQRLVGFLARGLGVDLDELRDAVHQRMRQPLGDRRLAPREIGFLLLGAFAFEAGSRIEQTLRAIRASIQNDVFDQLTQVGRDVVVDGELARVDDAHVHTSRDGVVEENGVHRLAHRLVAAKRERQIRNTARDVHQRKPSFYFPRRFDEGDAIAVVLLDAGRHGEDIRVEDDVLGGKPDLRGQQLIGARADIDLALDGVGLALFVERHDDDGGAVAQHFARLLEERILTFLHRNGIDDRLALHAFQARLDHRPFRTVDHDGHTRDIGLRRDHIEKRRHRLFAVEQAFVHVHVDDLRAGLDLLARDDERCLIVVGLDQLAKLRRTRDVRALADIDEGRTGRGGHFKPYSDRCGDVLGGVWWRLLRSLYRCG